MFAFPLLLLSFQGLAVFPLLTVCLPGELVVCPALTLIVCRAGPLFQHTNTFRPLSLLSYKTLKAEAGPTVLSVHIFALSSSSAI